MSRSLSALRPEALIDAFQATLPWPLDPFQVEAIEQLESHHGVLVSAPTSSGKTVIADYAVGGLASLNVDGLSSTVVRVSAIPSS